MDTCTRPRTTTLHIQALTTYICVYLTAICTHPTRHDYSHPGNDARNSGVSYSLESLDWPHWGFIQPHPPTKYPHLQCTILCLTIPLTSPEEPLPAKLPMVVKSLHFTTHLDLMQNSVLSITIEIDHPNGRYIALI